MCGITGIINQNLEPIQEKILSEMTKSLLHRGPDQSGTYNDGPVGLGHQRLSIIDLSKNANQPMTSSDKRYTLIFNGEIYNFKELKEELKTKGHHFKSNSDTEVLLNAYIEWKENCLNKLNGMFAMALWDKKEKILFLARDRYGIKPLFYTFTQNSFLFASEIKAFLKNPQFKTQIDKEALLEYFTFQNIFTDKTLFKNVRTFPKGSYMILKSENIFNPTIHSYWDYQFEEISCTQSEEELIYELQFLFERAVKRQLVSDVKLGCYLSGGIDSSSITAIASKEIQNVDTFTCGFDLSSTSKLELDFDEREKAREISSHFKTNHHEIFLKSGDMEQSIPQLTWHLDEPRVGQSYPNYFTAKLASQHVKVVLAGTGGDELFGGYPWRYYRAVANDNFEDYIDKYYLFWQRLIPNKIIHQAFQPIWNDVKHVWTRDIFKNVFQKHANTLTRPQDYINHSLYFEAKTFLHGLLLVEDKLSMAHGLETRVPFLDNDLVDFAMKLPVTFKLGNLSEVIRFNENESTHYKTEQYYQKTKDGKLILRKAMESYVPKNVTQRKKQGFSAPDASWFKDQSIDYVKKTILNDKANLYHFMDKDIIYKLVNEHLNGQTNRRLFIWSLINFEEWCHQFLD